VAVPPGRTISAQDASAHSEPELTTDPSVSRLSVNAKAT
jgi:hypothetical protein